MPSTIELAARLSAVVDAQQEILAAVNDPDALMQVVATRLPDVVNSAGAAIALREGDALVVRAVSRHAPPVGTRIPIAAIFFKALPNRFQYVSAMDAAQ